MTCATLERTTTQEPAVRPRVDIWHSDSAYILEIEVPGVEEQDIDLKTQGSMLTLVAKTQPAETGPSRLVHCEFQPQNYSCSFNLPDDVDPELITAELKHGVLTLTLAKKEKAQPRKIDVKV
jgi:HSP20 family protein